MLKISSKSNQELLDIRDSSEYKVLIDASYELSLKMSDLHTQLACIQVVMIYNQLEAANMLGLTEQSDYDSFYDQVAEQLEYIDKYLDDYQDCPSLVPNFYSVLAYVSAIAHERQLKEAE
ncbi:hypothetical protein [Dipodfec virus UOA04_Rod_1143]|nr:hypothetical protein [Dipodfec virus UOA04_Rod_1143]